MSECGKYIDGPRAISYPCNEDRDHVGPCAALELPRSKDARERWLQQRESDHILEQFQGVPRTAKEGLHADPSSVKPHPSAPVKCPECDEAPMAKDFDIHLAQNHGWGQKGNTPSHAELKIRKEQRKLVGTDYIPTKQREGDQPLPVKNDKPFIQDEVIKDIEARKQVGIKRYGTALQPFNQRDAFQDAYEEAMDLCMYLKQLIIERDSVQEDIHFK